MELSVNSSLESCDDANGSVRHAKKQKRWGRIEEVDLGVVESRSKETYQLLQRCADYVRLYYVRYQEKRLPHQIITRMLELVHIYGIPLKRKIDAKKIISRMIYPDFCNLLMFLNEIDKLETLLGHHLWDLYYISSADLFASCENSAKHFTIRIISVIRTVFDAVRKRKWEDAVLTIGNIRLVSSNLSQEKEYLKETLKAFSYYFPSLYYVVLQRHLESGCSLEVISKNYSQALLCFVSTCVFKNQSYDYSEFYLTQFLVFHLAHQLLNSTEEVLQHNLAHQDPEWARVRQIYRYWIEYEKWQNEIQKNADARLSPILSSFFSTMTDSLLRTINVPMDCVGMLPVLINLAKVLDKLDELRDALTECCCDSVSLLSQVTRQLNSLNLHHISGFLFSRAMEKISAESLSGYDFVIDIVEQQSLDPASHGAFEDLIAFNLRILFNFLDHGRNRANARAWGLLKANFLYLGTEIETFLKPLWNDRCSWWPAFHTVYLDKEIKKVRKNIFTVLNSLG